MVSLKVYYPFRDLNAASFPRSTQIQLLSQLTVQSIDFPLCATREQYILHLWDATVFASVFLSYTAISA
jgi:hypothetical protein